MLTRRIVILIALCLPSICVPQSSSTTKTFEVTGKVQKPGKYELREGMRVFDALGTAGGFLDFADTRKIRIIRGNERRNFNYRDYVQGKRSEENILLELGDVIVVP
jgi:protein involved in polysaccharide export with SLBB domain